ncbi:MAG: hypothetical protein JWN99_626 [Ilumatobacteraceae bacterium]|nr:hypothetical protein [Ilumatobacteraceae bacterium]
MGITIETPTDDRWPEMFRADARGFGFVPAPDDMADRRPIVDLARFRVAVDDGEIVGVAGSYAMDVTLPGGVCVPASAVTWVSVATTHRRRGILTRLIDACHADADDRGEPVAILFASEGGIYERFGYGIATQMRATTIDRAKARFRADLHPDRTAVRFLEGDAALAHRERLWEPFRRLRAGEVTRSAAWHEFMTKAWDKPAGTSSPAFHLAHDQGYALYRIAQNWAITGPSHRLEVVEVVALTPTAHLDLWSTLMGVDLVASVEPRFLPLDDPLPHYFTDSRVVRTTAMNDGLWGNVRNVGLCFGTRLYGTTDRLVIEVDAKRWAIDSDGVESSCKSVRTRPDLVLDLPSAGALLFGGIRPSQLVAAGRITARSADVCRRADAFFLTSPVPHIQTHF